MSIAFIGLGNMGSPMARNLAAAGLEVRGFDIAAPMPDGVLATESVSQAVEGAEVIITMLPDGRILRAVAAEIVSAARPGACFVDCFHRGRRQRTFCGCRSGGGGSSGG